MGTPTDVGCMKLYEP